MKKIVLLAALLLNTTCIFAQKNIFIATDLTREGEFTNNCEGPSVDKDGNIYAVNINQDGTIAKITPDGKTTVFLTLPDGSVGNGIRFGAKNTFFVADFMQHNVLKIDLKTKQVGILAHVPGMNQPNDLAIMSNGTIFCSDPNWKESTGQIWKVTHDGKAGLLAKDMGTTNGIEVSPDEKTLYVNESVQKNVWAFDITPQGTLANKRLLIKFEDGGMDGMRCDDKGNLYITRHGLGTIDIVSPEGKVIQTVKMKGKLTSNICFGGKDGKTCYVTLQDRKCLETFRTINPGREWKMMKEFK
ncbi:SMP-30/gluconolactonase/LRE family protein [Emticicia sp. BO119]|uniref:SMP-30/gluconolactonase/LRE family protein n=1 Tax=Emticicia sp. BO119 TaxID=2757768 RepID=UPI0015F0DBF0|nr:SMP-30/gluconolactonase/LRE family protein [Emticicia sp. BO119]MBA4850901.1 SMP-30/gluconolactonase/LRE family protein [Emticicia sp. BO119]